MDYVETLLQRSLQHLDTVSQKKGVLDVLPKRVDRGILMAQHKLTNPRKHREIRMTWCPLPIDFPLETLLYRFQ
jgi:hypothetical protein